MLDLTAIDDSWLDHRLKGFPPRAAPVRVREVAERRWNVLAEALPFPCAVLRASALDHNERRMQDFCAANDVSLAPHGKTTMAPQLFARQLAAGAWGMTVATVHQLQVCVDFGIRRLLLANQLVGRADIARVIELMGAHPELELHFLIDTAAGLERIDAVAQAEAPVRPLSALVELGYLNGRTGARSQGEAVALARAIAGHRHLRLAGVECYEGLRISQNPRVDAQNAAALIEDVLEVARRCDGEGLFTGREILLSAGGSALYDVVGRELHATLSRPVRTLLRSGCYVTHDSGFYERLQQAMRQRATGPWRERESFRPALEVWAQVQSRPQADLAILTVGRRDVSYDVDLPQPRWIYRPGRDAAPVAASPDLHLTALNDQHAYLRLPTAFELSVGDLVGCGISHPCTTFDKWQLLWLVDDDYAVAGAIRTFF
jgi:D-serine dehydratase